MKLKVYVVDLEIPPRAKRWALRLGIPALALGIAAVALAAPPVHTWAATDTLTASDLNGNFSALDTRIAALESGHLVAHKNGKQYSLGATYCGFTAPTTGAFSSAGGTLTGYAAAKDLCEKVAGCGQSPSAHMCTASELLLTTGLGIQPIAGWFSGGLYQAEAKIIYDCSGWTSANPGEGGESWNPVPNSPSANVCSTSTPVLCCD
jgi:hypothetical protein